MKEHRTRGAPEMAKGREDILKQKDTRQSIIAMKERNNQLGDNQKWQSILTNTTKVEGPNTRLPDSDL